MEVTFKKGHEFRNDLKQNFSKLFSKRLAETGIKASDIAKKIGVTRQAVSDWKHGRTFPKDDFLNKLDEILDFKQERFKMDLFKNVEDNQDYFFFDFTDEIPKNSLPVLGYATAGLLEEQYQQNLGYVEVPQKFANNEKYIAVKVSGDSMNRVFEDETITVFDRNAQTFQNKIVLVEINNQTTIKRFYDYGNVIILKPDSYNPVHQDIIVKKEEIETLKIYGRLVYYCKEVL